MKKRIMSVLLALVMALSLCTVALAEPDATDGAGAASVTTISLEGFYYGNTVGAISATVSGNPNIVVDSATLKAEYEDGSRYDASNWIGCEYNYYLEVVLKLSDAAAADYTLPTTNSDYDLFVRQYNNNLSALDPDLNLPRPAPNSIMAVEASNNNPATVTLTFPLTLTVINYNVTIPLTKNVTKGGNVNAPATTFDLEIKHYYDVNGGESDFSSDYADYISVTSSFDYIPGTSNYNITVTGPKAMVNDYLEHGFFVHEKTHSDTHWACDTQCWFVQYHVSHSEDGNSTPVTCFKVDDCNTIPAFTEDCNGNSTVEHYLNGVTFTNVYTKNVHRVPSSTTPTAKIEAPKTFDAGIAVYGVMAVSSLFGMGYVGKKKF